MNIPRILQQRKIRESPLRLKDGSRIAVIGGGPAGSFFGYFVLGLADRLGVDLKVDIYEPRDFSLPAPRGCNMCAGIISETLVQNLATEGINLPACVIQKAINSYVLHTDVGTQRLDAASHEKRIGVIFRGSGPRGSQEIKLHSFDSFLLSMAMVKGGNIIPSRVTGVERVGDRLQVKARGIDKEGYDLVVVATGVNTSALKLFADENTKFDPPKTTKTALREYRLGKETIDKYFGDSLHVFLLDIPRLDLQ
jgi:flavin-dependent dehydrogenase